MPLRGRAGGHRLCAVCGQAVRRGGVVEGAPLVLFEDDEIEAEACP
jgi:hypothetical protein